MANLFDKTWEKLNTLQEDFTQNSDVIDFFDGFAIDFITQLQKNAARSVTWEITKAVYNPKITVPVGSGGKEVFADVDFRFYTKRVDPSSDNFDMVNIIPHTKNNWEEYPFLGDNSKIVKDILEMLQAPAKHGIKFTKKDFNNVEIGVANITYTKKPYAYRYLNSQQIKISHYGDELDITFTLSFKYFAFDLSVATTPGSEPRVKQEILGDWGWDPDKDPHPVKIFVKLDECDKIDLTKEFKEAILQTVDINELIKKLGIKLTQQAAKDTDDSMMCEVKVKPFRYDDQKLYDPDAVSSVKHYFTWVTKDFPRVNVYPYRDCNRIVKTLSYGIPYKLSSEVVPVDIISNAIEYFHLYIKNTANDLTDIINNYIDAIAGGNLQAKRKLDIALDGVSWKGTVIEKTNSVSFSIREHKEGIGFDNTIKELIEKKKHFEKFTIVDGDF